MKPTPDDEYSDEEAERRAREAIRRSFEMPHKPQKDLVGKAGRARSPRAAKPKKLYAIKSLAALGLGRGGVVR